MHCGIFYKIKFRFSSGTSLALYPWHLVFPHHGPGASETKTPAFLCSHGGYAVYDHPARVGRDCLGFPPLDRRAARGGPACVPPRLFHLAGPGRLPRPALADRRHRHLHDLPPPPDPPQLRDSAPVARIRSDGHRLLRLRRGGRSAGWPITASTTPTPTTSTTFIAPTAA